MRVAHGSRDEHGVWHPDDPTLYPAMDVHGQLPWSVLDQTARHWHARKQWWRSQGPIDDLTPRHTAAGMITTGRHARISGGVSVFDPFLAELCYTWHTSTGATVFDPFAGGPVRGVVAAALGRHYTGLDLSADQVDANNTARHAWGPLEGTSIWNRGDAAAAEFPAGVDYILTCPPYHNRERYSDHPADLSAMTWPRFRDTHQQVAARCAAALAGDRFLTWVISDIRDHKGHLRGLPGIALTHLRDAGLHLCNEQILIAPPGTRAKTMRPPWEACRTTSRRHQIIYTLVKGDRRAATAYARGL